MTNEKYYELAVFFASPIAPRELMDDESLLDRRDMATYCTFSIFVFDNLSRLRVILQNNAVCKT